MGEEIPEIEADDAYAAVEAGAFLLDVREPDEWAAGHAPDAVHVPMTEVLERVGEVPRDRLVVAICRSGGRSRAIAEVLAADGYDVVNTIGGMRAWQMFGYDVVTDAGTPGAVI
ncbi:MAG: rhodanese-like domain-containing protein [Acidimicrobiia bacterium]